MCVHLSSFCSKWAKFNCLRKPKATKVFGNATNKNCQVVISSLPTGATLFIKTHCFSFQPSAKLNNPLETFPKRRCKILIILPKTKSQGSKEDTLELSFTGILVRRITQNMIFSATHCLQFHIPISFNC